MLPEQQQRILGYFLEEANDHLNTIEQGLLNLQSTLADSEMVNEIFRAAHSIKGGAAMLGLNSIQRTAHRLEDFFKILKECPSIQIEQTLESLFLQVFDNLKALLEQLQNGSSLSDGEASQLMAEVEPVFAALEHQLSLLVGQAGGSMHPDELPLPAVTAEAQTSAAIAPTWAPAFEYSVPEVLRELLQLFKQPETSQTRQELQACCTRLAQIGKEYDLSGWLTLCETAAGAIANADNSYRTLAPVIIRELKQAQELVLAHRAAEITICEQLQALSINTFLLDWEEDNSKRFELDENQFINNSLALGAGIFVPPAIVDNEVKIAFSTEGQLDNLSNDDALSSLFISKSDSNNHLWQETTDLLNVINDRSDDILLQDIEARSSISSEETLALNNLFTETQDISLDSIDEEPIFCNLFSAPTAGLDDVTSLEATNPTDNSENVDINQFWVEETNSFTQVETPISDDNINNSVETIADAEIQLELGNELAVSNDLTAFVPQAESELTESEFDLAAIADPVSITPTSTTDADNVVNDVTESLTEWDSEIEAVGLDGDRVPIIEIDNSSSLATSSIAAAINEGWDDSNEALESGFDSTADLFTSSISEEIAVTNIDSSFILEESTDEIPTANTASIAQWDISNETLETGFDSATMELDNTLNLELESERDLLTNASLTATNNFSSTELMVGSDADSDIETSFDSEHSITSTTWDTGEAELSLGFDAITAESEDTLSFELEPSLELDNNFSFMIESGAELFSTSTAAIIDENITELMSVVESIYQDADENEVSLGKAQADFLADSQLEANDDFPELNALLHEEKSVTNAIATAETLLDLSSTPSVPANDAPAATTNSKDDFGNLEQLLPEKPKAATPTSTSQSSNDDFGDLEQLLQKTPDAIAVVSTQPVPAVTQPAATSPSPRRPAFEQMMRVPVKQLDSIGNMVGELVVYRNSLEQDQERLRQFLDNLLHQVQQLGDVGTRMQELYERSLLEASLLNSRQGARPISVPDGNSSSAEERHATGVNFDALEMDRFTGFHTLAQETIELIVRVREASSDIEFVTGETEQVARNFRQVTTHLQEGIMRSRMVPFSQIAERLPRAVRDIALKYGKQAELQVEGNETLIDKGILEQLYDPMTHLVNNAITHGIETPDERTAKGKAAAGKITIRAFYQGNQTVITVSDNGAGIDPEKVKAKAIANGLITPAEADDMDRLDIFNLIFQPGFSTKEQVDQFAGRGIGMDVVLTSLKQMRGTIHTDSNLGKGTTFTIRLPLTLSICKALCCVSDKARIAFPMDGVEQMIDIPVHDLVANAEGQTCIPWRDSLLPFRPLKELLGFTRQLGRGSIYGSSRDDNTVSIVILRSADTFFALQVDQVLGEQEIVIKQFEAPAPKPVGIAGATILGDGRIVPIADVLELIDLSRGRLQKDGRGTVWSPRHIPAAPIPAPLVKTEPLVLIIDDSITVRELLSMTFTNAGYRVEQARDGQEAWDKLRDGLPCDLIFCDIEMPRMDGLELLSRMQKEERLSQLPIAMLTSRGSDRHRQMALQLGASGYFTKPYLEEALLDGAQRMLRGEVLIAASSTSSNM